MYQSLIYCTDIQYPQLHYFDLCLPPGYSINYIKGAAFSVARLLGPTTITKQILVWSNWLWTRTHSRFNQLSICQSNLIFTILNKFWPSKGEGYKERQHV